MAEPRRLTDTEGVATYLDVSTGTVRGLVADGILTPVRLPSTRRQGEASRRLLFDLRDVDQLIEAWKAASLAEANPQLRAAALKGWENRRRRRA